MLKRTMISHIVLTVLCLTYVSCLRKNFLDNRVIFRLRREVTGTESTTPDPDMYPTPVDNQNTPTDTVTPDPDYQSHLYGDTGHSSANEGQGHMDQHGVTGSDHGFHSDMAGHSDYRQGDTSSSSDHGFHSDMAGHSEYHQGDTSSSSDHGFHSDMAGHSEYHQGDTGSEPGFHSDMAGQGDYPTSDPGQGHDRFGHSEHYATDMSGDYHNPLDMTRPGESPPRYLSNVQHDPQEHMPRALPLIQEPAPSESPQDGTQLDPGQGEMTGDPGADGSSQDMPRALPLTQEFGPDTGRPPIALPQKQGTTKTKAPSSKPDPNKPSQGQKPRPRPRPRPGTREPINQQPAPGAQDPGTDLLAAAVLNPDVHDTVVDGMEMIAKQQAIDQLDRQLSGATRGGARDRGMSDTRGRPGPNWGGNEQPSAPRRSTSRGVDPLDTLARVHTMKAKADLVQDHVDTVHDIHQDRRDYMYGSHDPYDPPYGRHYDPRYDSSYDRYYRGNPGRGERFPSNQNFESHGSPSTRDRFPSNQNFESRRQQYNPYPQPPPYYRGGGDRYGGGDRHDGYHHYPEDGYRGYPGYQRGYSVDINTGLPCTNMSDPRCRAQSYGEIQIETPHGEMDMEPGELDLEGAAAEDLLKMLGFAQNPALPPGHQEININHNVLAALQSRFGVNNTADIRRMSSNRDFQRFMYQVLTHSGKNAHGEYNANLTKVEVDRLLANIGGPGSRPRLRTANLDHAELSIAPPIGGANDSSQSEAVVTLDGGPPQNSLSMLGNLGNLGQLSNMGQLGNMGQSGNIPGFAFPLVQNEGQNTTETVAQPGSVAALVQTVLGSGGEGGEGGGGEAGEGLGEGGRGNETQAPAGGEGQERIQGINATQTGEKGDPSEVNQGEISVHNTTQHEHNKTATAPVKSAQTQNLANITLTEEATNTPQILNTKTNPPINAQQIAHNTSSGHKETDILGKDGNPKISKDSMVKAKEATSPATNNVGSVTNVSGAGAVSAAGASNTASETGQGGGKGAGSAAAPGGEPGTAGPGASNTAPAGGSAPGSGASQGGTGIGQGGAGTGQGGAGSQSIAEANNQPIGLAEAGIDPATQVTEPNIPTEALQRGYKASTAFAIASITLIVLAIIVGPILCLLCKWREKYEQKKRKEKAMKNRDMSENNIWDSMMLHEFGHEAPNFVANEAEAAANYYKTDFKDKKHYYDINEIEALKPGRHSPTGHLP